MSDWHDRFFSTTRGQVIKILRRSEASVRDLAEELDLTSNAIRAHLAKLEEDGLVREAGKRPGVRKPATLYELSPEAEQLFPKAYYLLLNLLLDQLNERLPEEDVRAMLEGIGRKVGRQQVSRAGEPPLEERIRRAVEVLEEFGAVAKIRRANGCFVLRGVTCPLAAAVEGHPVVCQAARALLEEITDASVEKRCEYESDPTCLFAIEDTDTS